MLVIYKHKRPAPGVINNRTEENRLLRRRSQSRAQPLIHAAATPDALEVGSNPILSAFPALYVLPKLQAGATKRGVAKLTGYTQRRIDTPAG